MQAAMDRVYSAHLPGARYRAVDEDLTALWLDIAQHPDGREGGAKFKSMYRQYFDERKRLLRVMEENGLINTGKTKIELLSETELYAEILKKKGYGATSPEEDFLGKCEAIRPCMLEYLVSSGDIVQQLYGEDDHQWIGSEENVQLWQKCEDAIRATSAYQALAETGWQGLIPPEMRKYYLEKFRCILGGADLKANDTSLLFHVATYLSSTLAKHQAGTLTEGLPVGTLGIRVPLVRPVDGRPSSHQSLIPLRTLPQPKGKTMEKRMSSTNRAAWLSLAAQGANKLRLVDTAKFVQLPEELVVPAQIYVVGPSNGRGSYLMDTAIILPGAEAN